MKYQFQEPITEDELTVYTAALQLFKSNIDNTYESIKAGLEGAKQLNNVVVIKQMQENLETVTMVKSNFDSLVKKSPESEIPEDEHTPFP